MEQRKIIYNCIAEKLNAKYPNLYIAQRKEMIQKQLPCVFIEQISKLRTRRYSCLDNSDDQYRMTFEVQVFSQTMGEAYDLMESCEEAFKELAFFEDMNIALGDEPNVYRIVARFSAQIGEKPYEMSEM